MEHKKICEICGAEFTTNRSYQICCSKPCSDINRRIRSDVYHAKIKAEGLKKVVLPATKSKEKQQEEWAVVLRKCKEAGLSYGEAVARGLVDG